MWDPPLPHTPPDLSCLNDLLTLLIFDLIFSCEGSEKTQNVVDIREGFYLSPELLADQFPEEKDLPGFADVITTYTEQLKRLG